MNNYQSLRLNGLMFQYKRGFSDNTLEITSRLPGFDIEECRRCLSESINIPVPGSRQHEQGLFFSQIAIIPSGYSEDDHPPLYRFEMQHGFHASGIVFLYDQEVLKLGHLVGSAPIPPTSNRLHPLEWFARVLLSQSFCTLPPQSVIAVSRKELTFVLHSLFIRRIKCIRNLFEQRLLYRLHGQDEWRTANGGRSIFTQRLMYFVRQDRPILFCLPAFPFKNPNTNKAHSVLPDGGEYEALTTLNQFCHELRTIYRPGCLFDIISDGHAFSDYVGVDDKVVNEYTKGVMEISNQVHYRLQTELEPAERFRNPIRISTLHMILFPTAETIELFSTEFAEPPFYSPFETARTDIDDICRCLLLKFSSTSTENLSRIIEDRIDPTLKRLYRGYRRLVLENLAARPPRRSMSRSEQESQAEQVALEMVQRNQCFSNLIDTIMPKHIRLSNRANDNSGPTIAICLLPPTKFQVLHHFGMFNSQSDDESVSDTHRHLQIPTPWRNTLVEIEGCRLVYVCEPSLVMAELNKSDSCWRSTSRYVEDHPRGGRFVLKMKRSIAAN